MAILAGGREQVSGYYSGHGYDYYQSAPARYLLTHALSDTLLPMLCATGRCLLPGIRRWKARCGRSAARMTPAPGEFWLKVTLRTMPAKRMQISGELPSTARSDSN